MFKLKSLWSFVALVLISPLHAAGQNKLCAPSARPSPGATAEISYPAERFFFRNLLCDQQHIWQSPFRLRLKDASWLTPMAGITTGLIVTDRTTSFELSRGNVNLSQHISDAGVVVAGAGTVAFYGIGRFGGNDHLRETGVLSAEAMLNTAIIDEPLKYAFHRDRPLEGDRTGHFFRGGLSMPSEHSGLAWSFAAVVASEYPGWFPRTMAYGTASAVSLARVTGKQHYLSDVFVGSALGYLTGKYVYKAHHNAELGGADYGTFTSEREPLSPVDMGSSYVPLDSWIYPALERLSAFGAIRTQFLGLRPWTRVSVAYLLEEAEERTGGELGEDSDVRAFYHALREEFSGELGLITGDRNQGIQVESLYTRSMYISGRPLNDSFHFGQTITNEFGRPYQAGYSNASGFTAHAENGRFAYYVRGEYQHAAGAAAYPLDVREVISDVDAIPLQPATPVPTRDQFRLLDTYVAVNLSGNQISVGKQSLWWGSGESGPLLMSNNAAPFYMLRITRTVPLQMPGFFQYLGPVRYDSFFGRLEGHIAPSRPFIHGQKFSFKPTPNLEFGFSRTTIFAGEGFQPLTMHTFGKSFFSFGSSPNADLRGQDPGDRRAGFDFSYRLPYLRKWLTLYSDSLVDDDPSPLAAPRRAAINPGLYLSHLPKLAKVDLRVEAVNTDPPTDRSRKGQFIYWNTNYRDSHLNQGNILGSWVGRESKGYQAWTTYWLNPQSRIQVGYRNLKVAKDFIPHGETLNDCFVRATLRIRSDLEVGALLQYEAWKAPLLAPDPVSNFTSAVQLTFWPKKLGLKVR